MHLIPRAFVRQISGLHLDLVNPNPQSWTDEDLAIGLSRTFRWGGHSRWPLPLSVAQHSLTVLALYKKTAKTPLNPQQILRELLHDAEEALIGGFDPIAPIKPMLGRGFAKLTARLQQCVFDRYGLAQWSREEYKKHKHADVLAAASEAVHVAGWSAAEVLDILNIGLPPLANDPLCQLYDCAPWEPWTPNLAAERFLCVLQEQGRAQPPQNQSPQAQRTHDVHHT